VIVNGDPRQAMHKSALGFWVGTYHARRYDYNSCWGV